MDWTFWGGGDGLDDGGFAVGVGDGEIDFEAGDGLRAGCGGGFEFIEFADGGDDAIEVDRGGVLGCFDGAGIEQEGEGFAERGGIGDDLWIENVAGAVHGIDDGIGKFDILG